MSIETWRKEFYPVDAEEREALLAPAAHSLRKWQGMLPENLAKHDVELVYGHLEELGESRLCWYLVGGSTCALCAAHFDAERDDEHDEYADKDDGEDDGCRNTGAYADISPACESCPIAIISRRSCDCYDSEFQLACRGRNVKPMIALLELCAEREQNND